MTLAARDGGSTRDSGSVMMRHGSSLVSVGAVRPPVAPVEPPSVAAGDSLGGHLPSVRTPAHQGHASSGRRHIFSPAGSCTGLAPTGVKPPFAPGHRLSVARPSVIVSAQGIVNFSKEVPDCESSSGRDDGKQPGRVTRPAPAYPVAVRA